MESCSLICRENNYMYRRMNDDNAVMELWWWQQVEFNDIQSVHKISDNLNKKYIQLKIIFWKDTNLFLFITCNHLRTENWDTKHFPSANVENRMDLRKCFLDSHFHIEESKLNTIASLYVNPNQILDKHLIVINTAEVFAAVAATHSFTFHIYPSIPTYK